MDAHLPLDPPNQSIICGACVQASHLCKSAQIGYEANRFGIGRRGIQTAQRCHRFDHPLRPHGTRLCTPHEHAIARLCLSAGFEMALPWCLGPSGPWSRRGGDDHIFAPTAWLNFVEDKTPASPRVRVAPSLCPPCGRHALAGLQRLGPARVPLPLCHPMWSSKAVHDLQLRPPSCMIVQGGGVRPVSAKRPPCWRHALGLLDLETQTLA